MATQIAKDVVTSSLGTFEVSTIQTFAGGGADNRPVLSIFADSDFAAESPWPFETMVFKVGSRKGLYHAPYATKEEALAGHALMVDTIKKELEFGGGVTDDELGTPTMTPEQWAERWAERVKS